MDRRPVGAEELDAAPVTFGSRGPQRKGETPGRGPRFADEAVTALENRVAVTCDRGDRLERSDRREDRVGLAAQGHSSAALGKSCHDLRLAQTQAPRRLVRGDLRTPSSEVMPSY